MEKNKEIAITLWQTINNFCDVIETQEEQTIIDIITETLNSVSKENIKAQKEK